MPVLLRFPQDAAAPAWQEEKILTEEEQAAKDDARRTFALLVFFGAAPSLLAQYELVWSKEKKDEKK